MRRMGNFAVDIVRRKWSYSVFVWLFFLIKSVWSVGWCMVDIYECLQVIFNYFPPQRWKRGERKRKSGYFLGNCCVNWCDLIIPTQKTHFIPSLFKRCLCVPRGNPSTNWIFTYTTSVSLRNRIVVSWHLLHSCTDFKMLQSTAPSEMAG